MNNQTAWWKKKDIKISEKASMIRTVMDLGT